jgi:hypothetical protein
MTEPAPMTFTSELMLLCALSLNDTLPGEPVAVVPEVLVGIGAVIGEEVFNKTVGT